MARSTTHHAATTLLTWLTGACLASTPALAEPGGSSKRAEALPPRQVESSSELPSAEDLFASPEQDEQEEGADSPQTWTLFDEASSIKTLLGASSPGASSPETELAPGVDLSPYLDHETWHQAMALKRAGSCSEALKVAAEHVSAFEAQAGGVQYAIATLYACAGDKKKARELYLAVKARGEGASALLAREALGEHVEEASQSASSSEVASETVMEQARELERVAKRKGRLEEGLSGLAALRSSGLSSWSWYQVRAIEAEVLEEAGRIEDANAVWFSVYVRARDWKSGAQIEDRIERFERRHKVEVIGVAERADRVRELVSRGRYKEAQRANKELVERAKLSSSQISAWSDYRKALESERNKDRKRAVELFEKAEAKMEHPAGRLRLYFGWARALRRLDRDTEAIALYDRMCLEYPAESLCADAMYEAGRLLQYQNEHDEARARFERLVGLFPDHRDVPDALWRAAFSAYLEGEYAAAAPVLRHLRDHYGERRDESELTLGLKAQYWLGVAALKGGDEAEAERELRAAIERGPLTWYGRLAAERLVALGVDPGEVRPEVQLGVEDLRHLRGVYLPEDDRLARAVELIRAGLYEEASAELGSKLRLHPAPEGAERVLASVHLAMGRPDLGHWTMKRHLEECWPSASTLRDWATAFPLDYMEHAQQWGEAYSVDPLLVQAIIRQESGFRPTVKSYAGAVGLMQLMPGTARYTARVFFEDGEGESYKRHDLLVPERNVKLGAMYIRVHTAHAKESVALALAGYNAGAKPLARWMRQYGEREMDAWVESITYREARGYVRKVMTSYLRYSWLYGGGAMPTIGLKVPEGLNRWGEVPERGAATGGSITRL